MTLLLAVFCMALSPQDIEFERIEIAWIAQSVRVGSLEEVLPGRHARLIRLLGHPDYDVRELAAGELERMGPEAATALCWGLRVGDPLIPHTSARLLGRLFLCENCGGSGDCPSCEFLIPGSPGCPEGCSYGRRCVACDGAGDLRLRRTAWNEFVEKQLFPPRGR